MRKTKFKKNGEKGGRPKGSSYTSTFVIPDFNTIILTENQYYLLLDRYGKYIIKKALSILSNWLSTSGYKYKNKNHYAYFRSDGWVINEAKLSAKPQT